MRKRIKKNTDKTENKNLKTKPKKQYLDSARQPMKNKKSKRKKKDEYAISSMKPKILKVLRQNKSKSFNHRQLAKRLGLVEEVYRKILKRTLEKLNNEGEIHKIDKGKYQFKISENTIVGKMDLTGRGYGYVVSEESETDIFIPEHRLNSAMNDDEVEVNILQIRKRGRLEGEVVKVLQRARTQFVGKLQVHDEFAFLVPDSQAVKFDIFIPKKHLNGGKNGEKAIAKILDWNSESKSPPGKIIEVIGKPGLNDTEMKSIVVEFDFNLHFPEKVIQAAEKFSISIPKEEYKKRRDFREITTFTIDPLTAKDFDDAISIQKLENGNHEIGVHIADVSHYVKENSALDKEAFKRGTSVYLVDRVVPMLPENLSNMVCSLRPDEEKLTFSAVFELNENAEIENEWFGRTVIKSDRRFTYEEAQKRIETGNGEFANELKILNYLALKIRAKKFKNGAINFDTPEIKFILDEDGKPLGIENKIRKEAHLLIEDYMLLANKRVARFIAKKQNGRLKEHFVYRIHDQPNREKLLTFKDFATKFGYQINIKNEQSIRESINKIINEIQDKPEQNTIQQMAIRSMAKAVYTSHNIGHYGLGFEFYTHFTSPIRRYPDVMVHRLLQHYLDNGNPVDSDFLESQCRYSSDRERKAVSAERASVKFKQIEMLQDKIGDEFTGIITGMKDYGFYVELAYNKCEGLVRFNSISWDDFYFDEANFIIDSKYNNIQFELGSKVVVELIQTDLHNRVIDLELIEE